jgi:hypothetical protein
MGASRSAKSDCGRPKDPDRCAFVIVLLSRTASRGMRIITSTEQLRLCNQKILVGSTSNYTVSDRLQPVLTASSYSMLFRLALSGLVPSCMAHGVPRAADRGWMSLWYYSPGAQLGGLSRLWGQASRSTCTRAASHYSLQAMGARKSHA